MKTIYSNAGKRLRAECEEEGINSWDSPFSGQGGCEGNHNCLTCPMLEECAYWEEEGYEKMPRCREMTDEEYRTYKLRPWEEVIKG